MEIVTALCHIEVYELRLGYQVISEVSTVGVKESQNTSFRGRVVKGVGHLDHV